MLLPHSPSGIAFVNSFKLQIYYNLRIFRHRCTSKRGKGTIGWFYGFKLQLMINDQGGISFTPLSASSCFNGPEI
ncbi:transposase [Candidatus Enterovibrio escicola]|uniref:Mobile element protein n=1 Tax=Candidatus Enterovibrio escicola TaxID=1927127 RepID=A0A2A5T6T0_9GAMM|nr:Mobile element protein [Candidatus Enterovibrio escacola]